MVNHYSARYDGQNIYIKRKEMKTQEEYISNSNSCIKCDSYDIEGHSMEIDDSICFQSVLCNSCGSEWQDVYHLVCYDNFEEGEVKINQTR